MIFTKYILLKVISNIKLFLNKLRKVVLNAIFNVMQKVQLIMYQLTCLLN
jgi:hypothetical protein